MCMGDRARARDNSASLKVPQAENSPRESSRLRLCRLGDRPIWKEYLSAAASAAETGDVKGRWSFGGPERASEMYAQKRAND
jgi:hypothetical protein